AADTPALLAEAGIDYLVDWSNDDQAYLMQAGSGAGSTPEHDPEKAWPALDAGWLPGFRKDHAPPKDLKRDDDSKKSHHALVSIPHQIEWDDIVLFWLRRVETWRYPDLVEEAARALAAEGAVSGRNFGLSIHPWLFGMAHRVRYLDEALAR